jgi:hypothetical protein
MHQNGYAASLYACHLDPRMAPLSATTYRGPHFCRVRARAIFLLRERRVAICRVAMVTDAINMKASYSDNISRSDVIMPERVGCSGLGRPRRVEWNGRLNSEQKTTSGWRVSFRHLEQHHVHKIHLSGGKTPLARA